MLASLLGVIMKKRGPLQTVTHKKSIKRDVKWEWEEKMYEVLLIIIITKIVVFSSIDEKNTDNSKQRKIEECCSDFLSILF